MNFTKEYLISEQQLDPELIEIATQIGLAICPPSGYLVLRFEEAPFFLREACCLNGGDEDEMILTQDRFNNEEGYPYWIDRMCGHTDIDVYAFNSFTVFVTAHS